MLVRNQDRKHRQLATSHKSSCKAIRRAECGKSACSVRRGGEWKPVTVRLVRHSQRNGEQRIDRTYGYGAILRPYQVVRLNSSEEDTPFPRSGRTKPLLLLHRRVLRLTLTPTSAKDRIMSRFCRLRRDSRSLVRGSF